MKLSLAVILPAIVGLVSGLAVAGGCECGIGAIYEVGNGHGCNNAACACPNYNAWFGEVDRLIQARCPEQASCADAWARKMCHL